MTIVEYCIDFFYRHLNRGGGKYEGQLMRAVDGGGRTRWQELSAEKKTELTTVAQASFETPYHSQTRETPGGSKNVKNVFKVNEGHPEGYNTLGGWWDNYKRPEEYYAKMGWNVEVAGLGEGVPGLKEARR